MESSDGNLTTEVYPHPASNYKRMQTRAYCLHNADQCIAISNLVFTMCDRLLSAVSKMVLSESIQDEGELKVHYTWTNQ